MMRLRCQAIARLDHSDDVELANIFELDQSGTQTVLEIVSPLGDLIGDGHHLAFQRRAGIDLEVQIGGVEIRIIEQAAFKASVLQDALAHRRGEIQPREVVFLLDQIHDTQGLIVVFESTLEAAIEQSVQGIAALQNVVEHAFAQMAEGGVPQVMSQSDGADAVLIQSQCARDGLGDLRDLQRVRHARAKMIALGDQEDLALVFQPPKSS